MKLRTLFVVGMTLFGLALVGTAASVLGTATSVAHLDREIDLSADIARGASDLGLLAGEYLLYGEEHQLARWGSKWAEVDGKIGQLSPSIPEERATVTRLDENLDRLDAVFSEVAPQGALEPLEGQPFADVPMQVSWSRLAVQSQEIAFDALRLQQILRAEKADVQQRNTQFTTALFAALGACFLAIYAVVYMRTMRSIARLRNGARIIGSGDLDFRIDEGFRDEIGELSRAFNSMTADLKDVTASKADLEREIQERQRAEEEVRKSERRLRGIIDEVPIGITLIDPSGAVLDLNDANREIWGYELPKASGVSEYTLYQAYHRDTDELMQPTDWPVVRTMETGEPAEDIVDIVRPDGTRRAAHVRTVPVRGAGGRVERIIGITQDVTESLERQRLDEALNDVSNAMGATLDLDEIAHRLLKAGQMALGAETAWIRLRRGGEWVLRDVHGMPDASSDPAFAEELESLTALVQERGDAVAVDDVASDPDIDASVYERFRIRSFLAFPVIAQGAVLGVAAFHHRGRQVPFTQPQVSFASKLMVSASVAVESALLYEREHRIADALQAALLSPPEEIPGLLAAYAYLPASRAADVGGDFYDLFQIDPNHAGVLVGDVSGKGLAAAQLTSLVRNGVRAYAYESPDPGVVTRKVNTLLVRSTAPELYATLFFGVLESATGVLTYCSGGHPPGILARSDGSASFLATSSPVVGAFTDVEFGVESVALAPGDVLILYTDGLVEARRGRDLFGEERLLEAARELGGTALENLPDALLERVGSFATAGLRDDTVILCVQVRTVARADGRDPVGETHTSD